MKSCPTLERVSYGRPRRSSSCLHSAACRTRASPPEKQTSAFPCLQSQNFHYEGSTIQRSASLQDAAGEQTWTRARLPRELHLTCRVFGSSALLQPRASPARQRQRPALFCPVPCCIPGLTSDILLNIVLPCSKMSRGNSMKKTQLVFGEIRLVISNFYNRITVTWTFDNLWYFITRFTICYSANFYQCKNVLSFRTKRLVTFTGLSRDPHRPAPALPQLHLQRAPLRARASSV